jgi:hypothetical protein
MNICMHVYMESELIFNNTQLLGWYIVGGGVILTGKPKCTGRKFCSIATLCTTNHIWTSAMLCELNFQSNWQETAGQMQCGDVQMPSHHTAKKYANLEKWWKRIHKNFRQLSMDMTVKFFWHQKSFISDVWFAYSVLTRETAVFQWQWRQLLLLCITSFLLFLPLTILNLLAALVTGHWQAVHHPSNHGLWHDLTHLYTQALHAPPYLNCKLSKNYVMQSLKV